MSFVVLKFIVAACLLMQLLYIWHQMGLKTFKNSRKGVECGSCELIVGTVNAYLLEEMKKATKSSVRLPVSQNKIQTRNLQIYEKRYSTG